MAGHLTPEQFAARRARTLTASELLQVDEHLASCDTCRDRLFAEGQAQTSGRASWIAVAAALLVAYSLVSWMLARHRTVPLAMQPAVTPEQQQAVRLALSTHTLPRAPILDHLLTHNGVRPGTAAPPDTFRPLSPVGTTVLTDRPLFRWQPAPGATTYIVAIFDEEFRKVAGSPAVSATQWEPEAPLPRDRVLTWQITATVGSKTVRAPQPPASEARFEILPAEAAAELAAARRDHSRNHLLLAVLLARAGALDDAAREIDALSLTEPETASELRKSLGR